MPRRFISLVTVGLTVAALLTVVSTAVAQVRVVPPHVLATIFDDEPPTPRSMTAAESQRWVTPDLSGRGVTPIGGIETPSEYAPNEGLFLRWGYFNSVIAEITVAVTTETNTARIFLIVSGQAQQDSAEDDLEVAGADLSRVTFLQMPSDTVWIRDYGPRTLFVDQERSLMDHSYNRPRPDDDQVPAGIAGITGEMLYELPLVHGGGNFHLFDNGEAFMSELIVNENPGVSEQDVEDYYADYHNLDLTILDPLPASFDSTQHLDMWFLPVDDQTVIIGEYDPMEAGGVPHQVTEAGASLMNDRGYTVLRTPGWGAGAHYTYTNSVIVNEAVLVCQFNGYASENAQAVAVFEQAFPDKTIVGIDCSDIINAAGAIHCIVMHYGKFEDHLFSDRFEGALN
ncbi:MAG: agmatine deiminase family protein [Xanthomonadales bacterium]|nr:agmatine deiminase family protein [Xanthomonadales bacterium]